MPRRRWPSWWSALRTWRKASTTTPAPSPGWATRRAPSITCAPRSSWTESSPRTRVRTTISSRCAAATGSSRSRLRGSSALEVQIELELERFRVDPRPPRRRLQARQGKGHLHGIADVRPGLLRREGRTLQHQRQSFGDGLEVETGLGCAGHAGDTIHNGVPSEKWRCGGTSVSYRKCALRSQSCSLLPPPPPPFPRRGKARSRCWAACAESYPATAIT